MTKASAGGVHSLLWKLQTIVHILGVKKIVVSFENISSSRKVAIVVYLIGRKPLAQSFLLGCEDNGIVRDASLHTCTTMIRLSIEDIEYFSFATLRDFIRYYSVPFSCSIAVNVDIVVITESEGTFIACPV